MVNEPEKGNEHIKIPTTAELYAEAASWKKFAIRIRKSATEEFPYRKVMAKIIMDRSKAIFELAQEFERLDAQAAQEEEK